MTRERGFISAPLYYTVDSTVSLPQTIRALLADLIDYAGLFPPASLSMTEAVRNYATYRDGEFRWALGRFVVPVSRLAEFESALPDSAAGWSLSALAGANLEDDLSAIAAFNGRFHGRAKVEIIETRTMPPKVPAGLTLYVEVRVDPDPAPPIRTAASAGARVKIRSGGVTAEAFPSARQVARFLYACDAAAARFKATAGLHHPLRCVRPLTYEPESPRGLMHGFLNLLLAAAVVRQGLSIEQTVELLEEESPAAFRFSDGGASWRKHCLSVEEIRAARVKFADSFGSCSFEEPIEDLRRLGWL